ncbi:MAG TPA: ATPase, T2SS/T4P/T4SS family [Thermohalobaculum sp.]|nr:ATPase, T2SS/T4P/T4SS family [Thermohalobaculum sp.]
MLASLDDPDAFARALGPALVEAGRVSAAGFERAARLAEAQTDSVVRVLSRLGLVSERDLAEAMAGLTGKPLLTADEMPGEQVEIEGLSPRFLMERGVLPVAVTDGRVVLAVSDPLDRYALDGVRLATGRAPDMRIAEPGVIEAALQALYADPAADTPSATAEGDLELDVERLRDMASEAPVVRWVNGLIAQAVEMRGSDIHIEPFEASVRVRLRLDGLLVDRDPAPLNMAAAIVSRIKIMARLNIAERRLPQDGRVKIVIRGRAIDLRVSTVPTLHGESVVMRILDRDAVHLDFRALGFAAAERRLLEEVLDHPNGVFLITGPTGSGKTTTLYAGLSRLASPEKKIFTVEDPVEYQIDGVNQVQVKPDIGLSFAHVLRSILRQDPDVIMVGEIRDTETARIAAQAALTGHLVLSTLHTNNAAATIARLMDMGVEEYLIASTIIGVSAQRLVRRLCPHCRAVEPALPEVVERFRLGARQPEGEIRLAQPVGCARCRDTGFSGRTALIETMLMTDELRRLVLGRASAREMLEAAGKSGFRTMLDNGIDKALAGETTLGEVLRVARPA